MDAPVQPDEAARLALVESLRLVEAPREERFERIARVAAAMYDVPVAFVSVIDSEQLWFKSCVGLDGDGMSRGESFCARTLEQPRPLVVPDLAEHEEFRTSRHVTEAGFRFYAGHPLQVDGQAIGTLCLLDRRPRQLDADQLARLADLAAWAENELGQVEVTRALRREQAALAQVRTLQQRDELILQFAHSAIYGVDPEGVVTFANPAAERLLGHPVQLVGARFHEAFHHTRPDGSAFPWSACPTREALRSGLPRSVALDVVHRADGTPVEVEYASAPIVVGGEVTGAVVTLADISERRAVERMKDEFVSVVSHELRTPLTSIRGSLGLLASAQFGDLPSRAARLVEIALSNTERLIRLVNDILDLERINAGRIELSLRTQPLLPLLEAARDAVAGTAGDAGVELEVLPGDVEAEVDHDLIVRAVTNLLGNAVKFSERGGKVTVEARYRDADVVVSVTDSGRGIPPDKAERIFERFEQVDATDAREKGGTGLGLAITRSIAERHGGQVSVTSVLGEGSTFSIALPAPGRGGPAVAPDRHGAWVVLVEDDADLAEVMTSALSRLGVGVATASGVGEAVELVTRLRPALLVLDVQLRDGDGFAVIEQLRRSAPTAQIPVLVSSVSDLDSAERARLTLGPTQVVAKAPSRGDVVHEVVEAVRHALWPGSGGGA